MAFNPYSTRPIGSEQYEEHLKDIETSAYYHLQLPVDNEDPLKLAPYGTSIWKSEPAYDPWEELAFAVTLQAASDYITAYKHWRSAQQKGDEGKEVLWHIRMLQEENDFFRRFDITERVFDRLLKTLNKLHEDTVNSRMDWFIDRIKSNYYHFCTVHNYQKGMIHHGK